MDIKSTELIVALTTVKDVETAKVLAHQIVSAGVVACCNIVPHIFSVYRWNNELCEDQECLLIMKTVKKRVDELDDWIHKHHPYEVPELITLPVTNCLKEYLSWVYKETG